MPRRVFLKIAVATALWAFAAKFVPQFGNGPSPETVAAAAALEQEVKVIGALIRERQEDSPCALAESPAWPVPGFNEYTSPYGMRLHPVLHVERMHTGVDIGAAEGAGVHAILAGRAVLVREFPAYGWVVAIDHGGRLATVYAHLSRVTVSEGEPVRQGSKIGEVGATGQVTGPHLHVEVRIDGDPVDPSAILS